MRKIIIGIDASRNRSGGARAHIIGILRNMDQQLLDHEIATVHIWSYPELLAQLPEKIWLIKHSPLALQKNIGFQLWWQYSHLPVEAKKNDIDILLNTDAGTVCPFRPAVTMSRDMLSYEPGEIDRFGLSLQRVRLFLLRYMQNRSLKHATAAIFLTKYASKVIQEHTGRLREYAIIPHGVSEDFNASEEIKDLNEKEEINCVYVSNVALYKHQDHVAAAIGELRKKYNINITFIGGGEGVAQDNFIKVADDIDPDRSFITQIDFLPHRELPSHVKNSDLFIFASSCENMPNTLVEGMRTGLPIVCSNRGPMPEVLEDGGLYFDPENKNEIASAVAKVISDHALRKKLRERSLELSFNYSWKRCSKETFDYLITMKKKYNGI